MNWKFTPNGSNKSHAFMRAFTFLVIGTFACAELRSQETELDDTKLGQAELVIFIKIEEDESWSLSLKCDTPVKRISFPPDYPHMNWKVQSKGLKLVQNAEGTIEIVGKNEFKQVELTAMPTFRKAVKDYEPMFRFSNGGIMVYSGQFDFDLFSNDDAIAIKSNRSILVDSIAKTSIVVDGFVHDTAIAGKAVRWKPALGETYFYVGKAPIIRTEHYLAVIDPGLPNWIRSRLKSLAPKLIELYSRRVGYSLETKPTIMFSFDSNGEGAGVTGGTLPGLVQLSLNGDLWNESESEIDEYFCWFLAHELAHLWNSKLIRPAKDSPPWMHEGASELMAYSALLQLRMIGRDTFIGKLQDSVDRYVENSIGVPLNRAAEFGKHRNLYDGGLIISLVAQQSIRQRKENDFFDFWRELVSESMKSNSEYDQQIYLAVLLKMSEDPITIQWIKDFSTTEIDVKNSLAKMFRRLQLSDANESEKVPSLGLQFATDLLNSSR